MKFPDAMYHYTVGPKLPILLQSGRLRPSKAGAQHNLREKAALWWSTNPSWEQTATKLVSTDGGRTARRLAFEELKSMLGAYRYTLDTRNPAALHGIGLKLFPWVRAAMVARIPPDDLARMTTIGISLGAVPTEWWGCLEDVPLSLEATGMLRLERLSEQGWVPAEGGTAGQAALQLERQATMGSS